MLYQPTLTNIPVVVAMVRRKIEIDDSMKEVICTLWDRKKGHAEIVQHLNDRYHFKISKSILKKHMIVWGKRRNNVLPSRDAIYLKDLKTAIMDLFVNKNATDTMILVDLESRGFPIAKRRLRRLRLEMGLRRRRDAGL